MHKLLVAVLSILLCGCGADMLGTATAVATEKKQEIEQGQQLKASVEQQLNAATQLDQQRLNAAAANTAEGK